MLNEINDLAGQHEVPTFVYPKPKIWMVMPTIVTMMLYKLADYKITRMTLWRNRGGVSPVPICNFPPPPPLLVCNQNKKALRDDLLGHHLL